ncbi:small nuclear ribonucleoprotein [Kwoniella heveanensis CBS 569]|nr:small nuclear ribonucleoprotein [Kwoniella heveanensis CBS 569]
MGRMAEMQRRLLEQMMGPEAMGIQPVNVDWWSERVCRNFLFGTCPHILFGNTKMDLGPCPKIHQDRILKQFQEHAMAHPNDPRIMAFRQEHENNLYGIVDDVDRRIRASQRKLEKTPEENRKTIDLMREIGEIELSIQGGTEEIEALGEAGKVEESMEKLAAVDALKQLKSDKEKELQHLNENAGASGHQKLRVCETCGAMLSVLDSDKRLADHFGGKLHLGYHELRKLLGVFAEARMTGRPWPIIPVKDKPESGAAGVADGSFNPEAGSGPADNTSIPSSAPAGPRSTLAPPAPGPPPGEAPHTPIHPKIPPADEIPTVGHGDKVKREAGELEDDLKERRGSRDEGSAGGHRESASGHRSSRDRERDDKYDKYDRERSSRYDDRDRRDRDRSDRDRDRSDRDRERDRSDRYRERDGGDRDRDRSDRDRRYERERSRSPSKRRVL